MNACTRCESPLEDGDLRCAICALPAAVEAAAIDRPHSDILRCRECHAAVAYAPEVQAPRCAFCGATMELERPVDPIEEATVRLPFEVDRDAATAALRGWLGRRGWFAPKTLRDEAVVESLVPLCWAAWIVTARAHVAWTADSDAGSQRSAWAPHAGELPISFDAICVPASRGLGATECQLLIPYYDLARAVPVSREIPGEPPQIVERFDAQRSAARQFVQRAIEATARTRVEPHIPGRRYRNVHVACLLERQTTERVALPAWVLAYRYRDTAYRAIVHGQRAEVVFGDSPKDWRKILAIVLGAVVVAAAIIAAIVLTQR